jgi:hypothetical protein
MGLVLALGTVNILAPGAMKTREVCSCEQSERWLTPAFVFSVPGQIRFKQALYHLLTCEHKKCHGIKYQAYKSIRQKLAWLMEEEAYLGCLHIQPLLYGAQRVVLRKKEYDGAARHLVNCPKDRCAQLRRALLLSIRRDRRAVQGRARNGFYL